jgi:DNA-3-methyladenine glycosylase
MSLSFHKLPRNFYLRPTLKVAHDLIGKFLVYKSGRNLLTVRLVEVEAYIGESDPACHAAAGQTKRNEIMYGPGGFSYIYLIYGMYFCLNVITENAGFPAAVLIRAAEPIKAVDAMRRRFINFENNKLTNGPGKLCKALNLTREHNGLDLTGGRLYLEDRGFKVTKIERSQRIGIKKGVDKLWRFYDPTSDYLSKKHIK